MSQTTEAFSRHSNVAAHHMAAMVRKLSAALRQSTDAARHRRSIAALSVSQLRDTGIDRSSIVGDKPSIEVDAGLMPYLMTLR